MTTASIKYLQDLEFDTLEFISAELKKETIPPAENDKMCQKYKIFDSLFSNLGVHYDEKIAGNAAIVSCRMFSKTESVSE